MKMEEIPNKLELDDAAPLDSKSRCNSLPPDHEILKSNQVINNFDVRCPERLKEQLSEVIFENTQNSIENDTSELASEIWKTILIACSMYNSWACFICLALATHPQKFILTLELFSEFAYISELIRFVIHLQPNRPPLLFNSLYGSICIKILCCFPQSFMGILIGVSSSQLNSLVAGLLRFLKLLMFYFLSAPNLGIISIKFQKICGIILKFFIGISILWFLGCIWLSILRIEDSDLYSSKLGDCSDFSLGINAISLIISLLYEIDYGYIIPESLIEIWTYFFLSILCFSMLIIVVGYWFNRKMNNNRGQDAINLCKRDARALCKIHHINSDFLGEIELFFSSSNDNYRLLERECKLLHILPRVALGDLSFKILSEFISFCPLFSSYGSRDILIDFMSKMKPQLQNDTNSFPI